jgi:hypothetical protein
MHTIDTVDASLDASASPVGQVPTLVGDPTPVDIDGFQGDVLVDNGPQDQTLEEVFRVTEAEVANPEAEPLSEAPQKPAESDIFAKLAALQAILEELKSQKPTPAATPITSAVKDTTPKNKRAVKPEPGRKYVRLGPLDTFGRVPQQQADIAAILTESMEIGAEWTEEELFLLVTDSAVEHDSIAKSVQHPIYLFTYYRGLKNDGKHAGFIARNFLRMIG